MKKIFLQFLKDNGVYFMFRENWKAENGISRTHKVKNSLLYIYHAFSWVNAQKRGLGSYELWQNLHIKWIEIHEKR